MIAGADGGGEHGGANGPESQVLKYSMLSSSRLFISGS